jgi:hypothetical protein
MSEISSSAAVVKLAPASVAPKPRKQPKPSNQSKALSARSMPSPHKQRLVRISAGVRTFLTAVNIGVICVSLQDIAACAMHYGHIGMWQGYALALGTDASYIGMEFAGLFAPTPHVRERIHRWTRVAVPCIAAVSAMANMTEFAREAQSTSELAVACVMGAFVPGVAYVVNRVLAVMYDG